MTQHPDGMPPVLAELPDLPDVLELRVLRGLHHGAVVPLDQATLCIGSDPACDVLLLDEGVKPVHLKLRRGEAGWQDEESGALWPLETPRAVGSALLGLYTAASAWPAPDGMVPAEPAAPAPPPAETRPRRPGAWPVLVYLGTFAIGAGVGLLTRVTDPDLPLPQAQAQGQAPAQAVPPAASASAAAAGARGGGLSRDDLRDLVQSAVDDLALTDAVSVRDDAAGLVVRGEVAAEQRAALDAALRPLRPLSSVAVTMALQPPSTDFESQLDAVVLGPIPFVVMRDGRRLFEGDAYGAYRVGPIAEHQVVLHGAHDLEVRW